MKMKFFIWTAVMAAWFTACRKPEKSPVSDSYSSTPLLPESPYHYPLATNDNAAALGRVLFYDKNLSQNNTVACASCHQQSKAFCDNLQFSTGLNDGKTARNAPSVFAKSGRMFWDGRASGLTQLVLMPVKNHVEMNFGNLDALAEKIASISYYPDLFKKAYPGLAIDSNTIRAALSEFIFNFNFSQNRFNSSRNNQTTLTAQELLGKNIFFGNGNCSKCHHVENPDSSSGGGYGFTDEDHNIGLDLEYSDNGVGSISHDPADNGKFMMPVLLNVEYTAPYMHDGRFKTLEDVVEHYNSGIQAHPNLDINLRDLGELSNLDPASLFKALDKNNNFIIDPEELSPYPPRRLNLSDAEKKGLVSFLKTLSDPSVFTDKRFSNPFKKQ
jgi:cytochrome c peroxidase